MGDLSGGLAPIYIQIELQEAFSIEIALDETEKLLGEGRNYCTIGDFQRLLEHKGVL